jgi:hypothetical protein
MSGLANPCLAHEPGTGSVFCRNDCGPALSADARHFKTIGLTKTSKGELPLARKTPPGIIRKPPFPRVSYSVMRDGPRDSGYIDVVYPDVKRLAQSGRGHLGAQPRASATQASGWWPRCHY